MREYGPFAYPIVPWDEYDGHPHQSPRSLKKPYSEELIAARDNYFCSKCRVTWRLPYMCDASLRRCWSCGKFTRRNTYPTARHPVRPGVRYA